MSSNNQKEICLNIYKALERGDIEAGLEYFHDDAYMIEPFQSRVQIFELKEGSAEGIDGSKSLLGPWLKRLYEFGYQIDLDSLHMWEEGNIVGAEYRFSFPQVQFSNVFVDVWEFEDGKVKQLRHYPDTLGFHVVFDLKQGPRWNLEDKKAKRDMKRS